MLINSNQINKVIPCVDICIIGTGIAASSLAVELLQDDVSFLMVEAGPLNGASNIVKYESVGRDFGLRSTTAIEVGGTSSLWHGVLAPLDRIDFQKRSWVPNSGWPISYEDLEPFYLKAGKILKLSNFDYFTIKKLPDSLTKLLSYLKFNKKILENKIFQRPMPSIRFKEVLISKFEDSKKHHIYYNAIALELVHNNSNEIKKLICGKEDGGTFEVLAKKFVVCAGALETPRLLLNSSIKNNNIGRFLMDHPMGSLGQIQFKKRQKAHIYSYVKPCPELMLKSGLIFIESVQKANKLPNHCFYTKIAYAKGLDIKTDKVLLSLLTFRDGGISLRDVWNVITNFKLVIIVVINKLNLKYKYADLFFVTEQTPNPNSKVFLSDKKDIFGYPIAKVNWQVLEQDILAMKRAFNVLHTQAFADKYVDFVHSTVDLNWNEIYTSAAHHLGTARMSTSSDSGVVDENLKVFDMDNLFICDGSVFPTSGNANSSLTTSALACRLASYLIKV